MNSTKNTQELLFQVSNFFKIQYSKNKKGIVFLILILSTFFNVEAYAYYSIPINETTTVNCKDNISFKNTKNNETNIAKTTKIIELLPVIKLGFEYTNKENLRLHHQIAISFQATNSFDYDKGYDSESYTDNETDIYWKFKDDHRKYVITGVQQISDDLEVPLEITMGYSGHVDLMVDEIQNISKEFYIKDKLTEKVYNLKDGKINLTLEKGVYSHRFVLAFKKSNTLNIENDALITETTIYADNQNQNIIISKNQEITIHKIELINILGKKADFWNIIEQKNSYQLALKNEIPMGVYIVKMNTNRGMINKKVLIQ